jgi:hypothetical protein
MSILPCQPTCCSEPINDKSSFPLTDILSSTSSGMRNITSNPQHYHCGGGLSSRWVDDAGQFVSHCRTVFPIYSLLHSRHRPLPQCKGFHLVENFIVDLPWLRRRVMDGGAHRFSRSRWTCTNLQNSTSRYVAGIEGLEPGPHLSASIYISLCDLPALLGPWGNPGQ